MSTNDIAESLFGAISTIVENRITNLEYDRSRLFKEDMQALGEMFMAPFENEDKVMLDSVDGEKEQGFFKREWELFKTDLDNANTALENLFGIEKKNDVVFGLKLVKTPWTEMIIRSEKKILRT